MQDDDDYQVPMGGPLSISLRAPAGLAFAAAAVPFFVDFHINGLHFVRLVGGGLAVFIGLGATGWALWKNLKHGDKAWSGMFALLAVVGGAYHLLTSGMIGSGFDLSALGGADESTALAALEDEGFEDVAIVETTEGGQGFSFEARRGDGWCTGSIRLELSGQTLFHTCGLPFPLERLESDCGPQDVQACGTAAARLRGVDPVDWPRATRLAQRACELGQRRECFYVGVAHELGERGLPESLNLAYVAYSQSCGAGSVTGCFNSGVMEFNGRGVLQDQEAACDSWERACNDAYLRGCEGLGECFANGTGRAVDAEVAATLFERACDGEQASGCVNLGSLRLDAREDDEAFRLYDRGCQLGDAVGCRVRARLVVDGRGTTEPPETGISTLASQCESGNAVSCLDLGNRLYDGREGVPQDRPRAQQSYQRGCELGDERCCRYVPAE